MNYSVQASGAIHTHWTLIVLITFLFASFLLVSIRCSDSPSDQVVATTTVSSTSTGPAYFEDWESGDEGNHPWYFGGHVSPEIVENDGDTNQPMDDSIYCIRFGEITEANQYSQFGFTIKVTEPSTVSFDYKIESEEEVAYLVLYSGESFEAWWEPGTTGDPFLDWLGFTYWKGEEKFYTSGFWSWERATVDLSVGIYDIAWRYEKTDTTSVGEDSAWIDNIDFGPGVEALDPQPFLAAYYKVESPNEGNNFDLGLSEKYIMLANNTSASIDDYRGNSDGVAHETFKRGEGSVMNASMFGKQAILVNEGTEEAPSYYQLECNDSTFNLDIFVNSPDSPEFYSYFGISQDIAIADEQTATVTIPFNSYDGSPYTFSIKFHKNWDW